VHLWQPKLESDGDAVIVALLLIAGVILALALIGLLAVYGGGCQLEPGGTVCF
jgi:hypothetical protein